MTLFVFFLTRAAHIYVSFEAGARQVLYEYRTQAELWCLGPEYEYIMCRYANTSALIKRVDLLLLVMFD